MRIALYLGNEIYPGGNSDPARTIAILTSSPLTSPILGLLNHDQNNNTLVFNDGDNPMYDADGAYIGPSTFPDICNELRAGKVREIYMSFSTNGTEFLQTIGAKATQKILTHMADVFKLNGVDFDYEGMDFTSSGALYFATDQVLKTPLKITSAPYMMASEWRDWVDYIQSKGGTVPWLNLQCYSGGTGNSPNQQQWNDISAPILGGCWNQQSPTEVKSVAAGWLAESKTILPPPAGPFDGGFFWAYAGIKDQYSAYMDAMAEGLGLAVDA